MNERVSAQRKGFEATAPKRSVAPRPVRTLRSEVTTVPIARHATQGGGKPLDAETCARMESQFGHDFSKVRVHTGEHASASAHALSASAYTIGQDIVFASGRYAPGTGEGRRLLAHELTHVVQQGTQAAVAPAAQAKLEVSQPEDAAEQEAEAVASRVMAGQAVQVTARTDAAIARDPDEQLYTPAEGGISYPGDVEDFYGPQAQTASPAVPRKTLGWYPDESTGGPYMHASVVNDTDLQLGMGMIHKDYGDDAKLDVLSSNLDFGMYGDLGKNMRIGGKADAQMFQGSTGNSGMFGADGGVFGANAQMDIGEDGFSVGAQPPHAGRRARPE